jgi:hypothetical protein
MRKIFFILLLISFLFLAKNSEAITTCCDSSNGPNCGTTRCSTTDIATLNPASEWQYVSGSIGPPTDADRYLWIAQNNSLYQFSLCPSEGGSANFDTILCAFRDSASPVCRGWANNQCVLQSRMSYSTGTGVPQDRHIQISGWGSASGNYTLAYKCISGNCISVCRICDPSRIPNEFNYYFMKGTCLIGNFVMCNSILLTLIFFFLCLIFIIMLFIKTGVIKI